MSDIERAAPPITLDALGTVFKMRADAAESLCITLASQQRGHLAEIERRDAEINQLRVELAAFTAGKE